MTAMRELETPLTGVVSLAVLLPFGARGLDEEMAVTVMEGEQTTEDNDNDNAVVVDIRVLEGEEDVTVPASDARRMVRCGEEIGVE